MNEDYIWTTKEGKKLKLKEIGNVHLLNIYRMLLQRPECYLVGNSWDGEVDCDFVKDYGLEEIKRIIEIEIEKRNLK